MMFKENNMRKKTTKRSMFVLITLFLFSFLLRALFVLTTPLPEFEDASTYSWPAWNLIHGNGYSQDKEPPYLPTARRGPTYPLFLAGIYLLFGRDYLVVRLAQAFIGAVTCILVYMMAKRVFDQKIAITSAILTAILPSLISYTNHIVTEVLFTFLLVLLGYILIRAFASHRISMYAIAGIILGVTVLCRPYMLFFPLMIFAVLVYLYQPRKKALKYFSVFLIAYMITIAPWTVRNYLVFQRLVPITTGSGMILYARSSSEHFQEFKKQVKESEDPTGFGRDVKHDQEFMEKGIKKIFQDPVFLMKGSFFRFFHLWQPRSWSDTVHMNHSFNQYFSEGSYSKLAVKIFLLLLDGAIIGLGFLGMIITFRNWKKYAIPLIFIVYTSAFYSLLHAITRYRIASMPYMIMFAVVGIFWCANLLGWRVKSLSQRTLI